MIEGLWEGAARVLRENDLGGWTKPAPRLYPHQWSWDSAFHAIGLAHIDPGRALAELEHLFRAQWSDGRVPHIVFDPHVEGYWPGPELWAASAVNAAAPKDLLTSGLIQPPMHALAVWHIARVAGLEVDAPASPGPPRNARAARELGPGDAPAGGEVPGLLHRPLETAPRSHDLLRRIAALYPKLVAWHRYLAERRDPERSGLLTVYHPWEGTDNTPRWDAALARVEIGELPAYGRHDVAVVGADERPSKAEYDRYLWLVALLRAAAYDDAAIAARHPFLIKDVQCSAIFAAASHALASIAALLGAPARDRFEIADWSWRASRAVQERWDDERELVLDLDVRADRPVRVVTSAGLSALILPDLDPGLAELLCRRLFGEDFAGAPGLAHAVVLSTGARALEFRPRQYWRGPAWPVINWLLWWGLRRRGFDEDAARLRTANLALLARPASHFAEYFEPYTAQALGSPDQSWTAAVTLDWLASGADPSRLPGHP